MKWKKIENFEGDKIAYLSEGYLIYKTGLPPPFCWKMMAPDWMTASYTTLEEAKEASEEDKASGRLNRRWEESGRQGLFFMKQFMEKSFE